MSLDKASSPNGPFVSQQLPATRIPASHVKTFPFGVPSRAGRLKPNGASQRGPMLSCSIRTERGLSKVGGSGVLTSGEREEAGMASTDPVSGPGVVIVCPTSHLDWDWTDAFGEYVHIGPFPTDPAGYNGPTNLVLDRLVGEHGWKGGTGMADEELPIKDLADTLRGIGQQYPKLITTTARGEKDDHPTTVALCEKARRRLGPLPTATGPLRRAF